MRRDDEGDFKRGGRPSGEPVVGVDDEVVEKVEVKAFPGRAHTKSGLVTPTPVLRDGCTTRHGQCGA